MAIVKIMIVFSFTIDANPFCPVPYFDLSVSCGTAYTSKRWYNGDSVTHLIDVSTPYTPVGSACQPFGGSNCGDNPVMTISIIGDGSATWGIAGTDHLIYACWSPESHYFPTITEQFAWKTVQKRESIGLVEEEQTPTEVAGYWILGVWVRKVRAKHDIILSSDHNNVTEVLKRAIALIKAKAEA
jgi:hypothetical protein